MNELLSMAEAAARLDVSRPYVSMLCDSGQLGEVLTEGGRHRVHASAVDAYLAGRALEHADAPSPREAGVEAGLYDHPDDYFDHDVAQARRRRTLIRVLLGQVRC